MIALLLTALSPQAHAAAYYFLDADTRGMGRAGAFVASADDLSAQYYNPAALIHLDRPQAMVDVSLVQQAVSFTRKDYDPDTGELLETYPEANNIGKPMVIPSFGLAHPLGTEHFMFALGFYPPYAPDVAYPQDGAQRYTLTDSLLWQTYAGPSVAWQPKPWITVGAGFMWSLFRAQQELTMSLCVDDLTDDLDHRCPIDADPAQNDVRVKMEMMDPWNFSGNGGLLIDPAPWLTIGASFIPPMKVKGKGTLKTTFPEEHWTVNAPYDLLDGREFTDDDITVSLTMPMIARLGVAVRPSDRVELELTGVYQGWHVQEEILISDVDLTIKHNPDNTFLEDDILIQDDVHLPANYTDSWSARLGGDWDLSDTWTIRGGGFFESSAVPPDTQGVALVDGEKWGYAAGGTWRLKDRLAVDAAFLQSWIMERDIKDSEVRALEVPINLPEYMSADSQPPLDIINGRVVGNGTFSSHLTQFSLGATLYWGKAG